VFGRLESWREDYASDRSKSLRGKGPNKLDGILPCVSDDRSVNGVSALKQHQAVLPNGNAGLFDLEVGSLVIIKRIKGHGPFSMRLIVRRGIVVDMLLGGVEDRRHWKTVLVMAAGRVDAERTDGFSPCLGLDEGHEGGIHVRLAGSLGCP